MAQQSWPEYHVPSWVFTLESLEWAFAAAEEEVTELVENNFESGTDFVIFEHIMGQNLCNILILPLSREVAQIARWR